MFDNNQPQSGIRTLFGPNGNVSAVVGSGSNTFAVIGSGDHDGLYFRNGNIVSGPDGMHAVIGNGFWPSRRGARDYRKRFERHRAVTSSCCCNLISAVDS